MIREFPGVIFQNSANSYTNINIGKISKQNSSHSLNFIIDDVK